MTLRSRLVQLFYLTVAALLLAFSVGVYVAFSLFRRHEFRERLEAQAYAEAALFFNADHMQPLRYRADQRRLPHLNAEQLRVYSADGSLLEGDGGLDPPAFMRPLWNGQRAYRRQGVQEVLGVRYLYQNQPYAVVVAAEDVYGRAWLRFLALALALGWAVSVGGVVLLGRQFARSALRPLEGFVQQADRISERHLDLRLPADRPDELGRLARTFNQMLDRLEAAFNVQRSFVAHASHEVRTPLAVISSELEVTLLSRRTPEVYEEALERALNEVRQLIGMVNDLLALAQVENELLDLPTAPALLTEVVQRSRQQVERLHPEHRVTMPEQMPEGSFLVRGHSPLLERAFVNLLDNGCKYATDHRCRVQWQTRDNGCEVRISNRSTGIPAADLPVLFEPFYRALSMRHLPGHGVGLALVRVVISRHGGRVEAHTAPGNDGEQVVTFIVWLPAWQD